MRRMKEASRTRPAAAKTPATAAEKALRARLKSLYRLAPELADVERTVGRLAPRTRSPGFASLVRILVGQQLSTLAATAIFARLEAEGPLAPEFFLRRSPDELRAYGLSGQKSAYCRDLAAAVERGVLDLDGIVALADEEAIERLTAIKGIGRWTAEIYLLFALDRPDVFPAQDLGLAAGYARLAGLDERPTGRALAAIAEAWRPHRSTAARLLWHYYDRVRAPV